MRSLIPMLLLVASPALASDAAQIYATTCASCHGPTAAGDGPAAASLQPKPADLTDPAFWASRDDAQIEKVIREGGPAVGKSPLMGAFGAGLTDQQLKDLVAYLKSMKK